MTPSHQSSERAPSACSSALERKRARRHPFVMAVTVGQAKSVDGTEGCSIRTTV